MSRMDGSLPAPQFHNTIHNMDYPTVKDLEHTKKAVREAQQKNDREAMRELVRLQTS